MSAEKRIPINAVTLKLWKLLAELDAKLTNLETAWAWGRMGAEK